MRDTHYISRELLDLPQIQSILEENKKLELSEEARVAINSTRKYLDKKMASSDEPFYGINTGFGSLCNVKISKDKLVQLQENLVISHACGTGEKIKPHLF